VKRAEFNSDRLSFVVAKHKAINYIAYLKSIDKKKSAFYRTFSPQIKCIYNFCHCFKALTILYKCLLPTSVHNNGVTNDLEKKSDSYWMVLGRTFLRTSRSKTPADFSHVFSRDSRRHFVSDGIVSVENRNFIFRRNLDVTIFFQFNVPNENPRQSETNRAKKSARRCGRQTPSSSASSTICVHGMNARGRYWLVARRSVWFLFRDRRTRPVDADYRNSHAFVAVKCNITNVRRTVVSCRFWYYELYRVFYSIRTLDF